MAIDYHSFLQQHHFHRDPFATRYAEHERKYLPALFHQLAMFEPLLGDTATPRAAMLVGAPGAGKTAHRLEVERSVTRHRTPALALTIDDVEVLRLLQAQPLISYVTLMAQLLLRRLSELLPAHSAEPLDRMRREAPQHYALLYTAWQLYAPDALYDRPEPAGRTETLHTYFAPHIGPRNLLRSLAAIVQSCGFRGPYILIDCLDEGVPPADPAFVVQLLRPLLINPGLLDDCGIAWRFFCSEHVFTVLGNELAARINRLNVQTIRWTTDDLCTMLSRRLLDSSRLSSTVREGYIDRLSQFFKFDDDRVDRALAALVSTPRDVLDLACRLIKTHCARSDDLTQPIDPVLFGEFVQAHGGSVPQLFSVPPPDAAAQTAAPQHASDVPLLRLGSDGAVTIGGEKLHPPLPRKLFKALKLLWDSRGIVVSYERFENALYESATDFYSPKSAREKLIQRLRKALEPNDPAGKRSRRYIDLSGDGYVLRNCEAVDVRHG